MFFLKNPVNSFYENCLAREKLLDQNFCVLTSIFVIIPFYDNKLFEQPEKSSEVVVPYLYSFFYSNTHKKYFGMVSKELKNIILSTMTC